MYIEIIEYYIAGRRIVRLRIKALYIGAVIVYERYEPVIKVCLL